MKRRMLSLLLIAVMVLGMLPTIALAVPSQSNGVYQIGTVEDLLWFAETVNGGETTISAVLTADIDLSETAWPGIGNYSNRFAGSFDGQNHTVTFKDANWGLFGYVDGTSAAVVTIKNVVTAGAVKRSAIAHNVRNTHISGCNNRATVTSTDGGVGGIVGSVSHNVTGITYQNDVLIEQCGNEASVTGANKIGGIVGEASMVNTRVNECYNTGTIHGVDQVGGLVGWMQEYKGECVIKNSYNTGRVTGTSKVGGIVGRLETGVDVRNCYSTGFTAYAIIGSKYNNTATITNSYFLGTSAAKSTPDFTTHESKETTTRATAVSAAEMATAEFAELLGDAFQQSCPTPVLTWQTAVAHSGTVCENCALGSVAKENYDVTFQTHNGYTLNGEAKATQGSSYSFTITISEGYEKAMDFVVKVNGAAITAASDGKYTVLNVDGPLSVTVLGVQVIPGSHAIQLPADGYGYRVVGAKTANRDEDYTFTLAFVDGFRAGSTFKVIAQQILSQDLLDDGYTSEEVELTGKNGTYTIPAVQKDYRILVSGVEAVSKGVTATISFSITEGHNEFHVDPKNDTLMMDKTFTVPYFDLSLYGLERYYYNPYCYVDENGNLRGIQQVGTPESAYDNITIMHAFIVATELYYYGYDQGQVGKGLSYKASPEAFKQAISWSQGAGSSFMDFWDFGTNLNYYLNYVYPLGYPGWGSTSDQILVKNGDVISIHMITGNASGSRFGFFVVNDTDKKYTTSDTIDFYEVDQGEKLNLTLYWTSTTGDYSTGYERMANKELYWIEEGNEEADVRDWNRTDFGNTTAAKLVTDANGNVTISTVGLEPGTYYLAALGGWTAGGAVDNGGFVSAGGETGPAIFKLVVNEYEGKLGDVDADMQVTSSDAAMILQYVAKMTSEVNESVADVDGDGQVTSSDAALILQYVAKSIDKFPAENK